MDAGQLREEWSELSPRLVEVFGEDAHVGENGHEVRVAWPPRNDMGVQVLRDAGARRGAEVHAHVDCRGTRRPLDSRDGRTNEAHRGLVLAGFEIAEVGHVTSRHDEEMTCGERIAIETDERVLVDEEHELLPIGLGRRDGHIAEDA